MSWLLIGGIVCGVIVLIGIGIVLGILWFANEIHKSIGRSL